MKGMIDKNGNELKVGDLIKIFRSDYTACGWIGRIIHIERNNHVLDEAHIRWITGESSPVTWNTTEMVKAEPEDLI